MKFGTNLRFGLLLIGVLTVSILLSYFILGEGNRFKVESSPPPGNKEIVSEYELALIYFGCSSCPPSNDEALPTMISTISQNLQKEAQKKGYSYHTVGISNEVVLTHGIEHLEKTYNFKEISLGNDMRNISIQHYVWDRFNESPNVTATPQVIIALRKYDLVEFGGVKNLYPDVLKEDIIYRSVGLYDISRLAEKDSFPNF